MTAVVTPRPAPDDAPPVAAWHALDAAEALRRLGSSRDGLAPGEAARRLARDGPNALREPPRASALALLVAQMRSVFVLLLVVAAAIAWVSGEPVDAAAIAAVLVLNVGIGWVTELRARRAIEALLRLEAPRATVVRGGRAARIAARELVAGDVILVEAGQRVPADARLLGGAELRTSEAILTGESAPVDKRPGAALDAATPLPDRLTMLYAGTTVVAGRGHAVVTATAMATEMGRIGELVAGVRAAPTPLERRLDEMGRRLAVAAVAGAAVVALLRVARGERILEVLQTAIAVAIAAVPEGLPAVSTIAMAVGIHRMARRRALIRRLPTVESLGSATVVCTDKTGTLTAGEMRAVALWTPTGEWREGAGGAPPPDDAAARAALRAGVLANRAPLVPDDASDPTEVALLRLAARAGLDAGAERAAWPEVSELPFSSERMLMATVHREPEGALVAFAKGAPRAILARAARIAGAAGDAPLDERAAAAVHAANDAMAARGLRVLALAAGPVRGPADGDIHALTLLALVGMTDPPAPGVPEAIARLHGAGVRTVMLTGDQRATALAVARELGVASEGSRALDGREVESLGDAELDALAPAIGVVSRVSPGAKLRIVAALQRRGEVVAMLGDGVNDAPALRQADVGVAMGGRGSDVAKEAAGVVLQDDRFETVAAAVEEGRRIDENIRRAIFYLVSCNLGELLVIVVAGLLGWPVPLTALQILWLNLLTDTLPALSLAVAPGAPDLMSRPPRPPRAPLFDRRAIRAGLGYATLIAAASLAAFVLALRAAPASLAGARTACFLALGLAQVAQLANVRDHAAGWRAARRALASPPVAAAVVTVLLLLATVAVPPLARVMRAAPPTEAAAWGAIAALAALPAVAGWLVRRASAIAHRTRSSAHA